VVALPALGQVNALVGKNQRILAKDLATPSAVAVLSDSSVLVAEQGANRVSGFGGRFGASPVVVADVPSPTGLAVGAGDTVYVTGSDQVGRIDLGARLYTPLAGGLVVPIGPASSGNVLWVPDLGASRLVSIDSTAGTEVGSVPIPAPGGAATAGSGQPVFVTDTQDGQVLRIDPGGTPSLFATVPGALQLALSPPGPVADGSWNLIVTTRDGYTQLSSTGTVVDRFSLPGIAGAVATPGALAAAADPGTSTVLKDEPHSSSSSLVIIVVLVGLLALAAVGVTVWFARRAGRREREDDALMPSPPDAAGLATLSGGCAEEQMEVERLQELVRHVTAQLHEARTRRRRSAELASDARDRAMRALEVRASIRTARLQAAPPPETEKLSWAQLSFSTDEGREAFESFRSRDIGGAQLRSRLAELGETTAITQISEEGRRRMRSDPTIPWPEERDAVRDAIAAREELRAHVGEAEEAQAESDQLGARQRDLNEELRAAVERYEHCRQARADADATDDH
jgi:hypothetical protein